MNILIACIHYPVCSGRYMAWGLKALGHNVQTVGRSTGTSIWGQKLEDRYAWNPTYTEDFEPDLVIVMESDPKFLDETRLLTKLGVPIVVYGVDNHVRYYRRPWFLHYFLAHKSVSLTKFDDSVDWLPCGFDSDIFRSTFQVLHLKPYDVAMIGVMYPQRLVVADQLRKTGLRVDFRQGLVYADYVKAYNDAIVSVCVSVNGDLAQRIFETAGMGNIVVTDHVQDLKLLGQGPIIMADSVDTIANEVVNVLGSGATYCNELVQRTINWSTPHSWAERGRTLLNIMRTRYNVI